jgi:hypothetical protein
MPRDSGKKVRIPGASGNGTKSNESRKSERARPDEPKKRPRQRHADWRGKGGTRLLLVYRMGHV